jgi:hypothetical protein
MSEFLLFLGVACAAVVGGITYLIFGAARTMRRGQWQAQADAIIARTQAAFSDLRRTVAESPRTLQRSLASALKEAERLLKRQEDLRRAGLTVTRGLENRALLQAQREVARLAMMEQRSADQRTRDEYRKSRVLLERQIAHYGALRDKLLQILENMREIQSVVEGMQPRIIRLALHDAGVQVPTTVLSDVTPSVLEELDVYIEELEKMDAMSDLLDLDVIQRDIEAETQRRLATGELTVDPALVQPEDITQR